MKKREKQLEDILNLLLDGKKNEDIAQMLGLTIDIIKKDISYLLRRYKVRNRTELALEFFAEKTVNL